MRTGIRILMGAFVAAGCLPAGESIDIPVEFVTPAESTEPPADVAATAAKIKQLQHEISTINLLNGLNLNREQTVQLLELGREYKAAKDSVLAAAGTDLLVNTEIAFSNLRSEIQKGMPARGEVPGAAAKLEHEMKELKEKAQADAAAKIMDIDLKLNKMLSAGQLQVIEEYKACLIPPDNLKNPVRAGQAADSGAQVNALRKLRAATSNRKYSALRDKMIDSEIEKAEKHQMKFTDAEKKELKSQMKDAADKARKMSDTKFEMKKEELAQALMVDAFVEKIKQQIEERRPDKNEPQLSKAGHFLLNQELAGILEERLKNYDELVAQTAGN